MLYPTELRARRNSARRVRIAPRTLRGGCVFGALSSIAFATDVVTLFNTRQPTRKPGGESGIRTHGRLPYTRFPSVRLRPLGHLSSHLLQHRGDRPIRHENHEGGLRGPVGYRAFRPGDTRFRPLLVDRWRRGFRLRSAFLRDLPVLSGAGPTKLRWSALHTR